MAIQLTADDARQSLNAHVAAKGEEGDPAVETSVAARVADKQGLGGAPPAHAQ